MIRNRDKYKVVKLKIAALAAELTEIRVRTSAPCIESYYVYRFKCKLFVCLPIPG